jgi:hypothetical protein
MKKIIKNFNNSIQRTIFKVQNKTNNNFNISNFNKYLISFIGLLFIYLFYLLLPLLYDKTWLQTNIENKLRDEFRVNLSTSANITYRILPAPHFLIKDSKILVEDKNKKKSIAEIKDFQVFLYQGNFFDKKKLNIKKVVINKANFSLLRNEIELLNKFKNKKFSEKKIEINNSNIFFKDNSEEIILIIKINKTALFFDKEKSHNFINLKGNVFNIPFVFDFNNQNDPIKYEKINFYSKKLKLNISNESTTKNELISGENNISFLTSTINTKYNVKEKLINFKSDNSRLNNSQVNYTGELSINPFDLNFNIYLDNHKISKLLDINSILLEFIQSGILFNNNISVKNSIFINSNERNEIFQNAKINFNIVNGKLNFDNSTFVNNKIGFLELNNSNLFLENNNLILNTNIFIQIKNSNALFSFLNTNKKLRKEIKNIFINLSYDFLKNEIKFNNAKINNNVVSEQFLNAFEDFSDNSTNNIVKSRRLINKLLSIYYEG